MGNFISRRARVESGVSVPAQGSDGVEHGTSFPVALPDSKVALPPLVKRSEVDTTKPDLELSQMLAVQDMAEERKKLSKPSPLAKLLSRKHKFSKSKRKK